MEYLSCTTLAFVHLPSPAPSPRRGEPVLNAQGLKWFRIYCGNAIDSKGCQRPKHKQSCRNSPPFPCPGNFRRESILADFYAFFNFKASID